MKNHENPNFQKVFGYTDQQNRARKEHISSEKKFSTRYKIGAIKYNYNAWYIQLYCLHKCNIEMLLYSNKYRPVFQLLEKEKEYKKYNWYFHIMILKRLKSYVQSLGTKQSIDKASVLNVVDVVGKMTELYEDNELEVKSKRFLSGLLDLVYELALVMEKAQLAHFPPLVRAYEVLLENCADEDLLRATISLQILIQADTHNTIPKSFTDKIWNKVLEGIKATNKDISQSYKDILTYLVIKSYPVAFEYPFKQTTQDLFLYQALSSSKIKSI